jgi:glutaminase
MPDEAFQQHVKSLVKRQLEPPKTMDSEFGLLYSEVSTVTEHYNEQCKALYCVETLFCIGYIYSHAYTRSNHAYIRSNQRC